MKIKRRRQNLEIFRCLKKINDRIEKIEKEKSVRNQEMDKLKIEKSYLYSQISLVIGVTSLIFSILK